MASDDAFLRAGMKYESFPWVYCSFGYPPIVQQRAFLDTLNSEELAVWSNYEVRELMKAYLHESDKAKKYI